MVPTFWQQNSQPSDPFPGYHRKTHKSQNSAVALSQQGYGSHFIDNALSIGSTQVRESLTAGDRSRLDAELLVCLLDAADTRDAVYEFHLSKARDLIGLGAQIRDGHLDYEEINVHEFDIGLPMQGFFYRPRAQRGYRKEAPRIQYRELNFLLNHGHHVYEEGTTFLRCLLNIVSFGLYESQHERFILALLLSRADVNSFVTRKMDKRVTVKKKFARQECRGTPDSYFGQTSLQIAAAKFRCYWLIPKLLEHGANYSQSDSQGRTSIDALIDSMRSDDGFGFLGHPNEPNETQKSSVAYKDLIGAIRSLAQYGTSSKYNTDQINRKAIAAIESNLPRYRDIGLANCVATYHGLTVNIRDCFHFSKRSCPMYRGDICEQKSDKILKANKQLVEVFKTIF